MIIFQDDPLDTLLSLKNKIDFFRTLSNDDIKNLIDEIKILSYNKNQVLFNEGSTESNYVLYLLQGKVDIYKYVSSIDSDIQINSIDEQMILGELHFLTGHPRNATVKAAKDKTLVLAFKIKKIQHRTFESEFYRSAIMELSTKLDNMNNKYELSHEKEKDVDLTINDADDIFESFLEMKPELHFFQQFSDTYLRKLVRDIELYEVESEYTIFKQGEKNSRYMYILINGRVDLVHTDQHDESNIVYQINKPTLFGEFHVLTGNPRDVTAITSKEKNTILAIQIIEFEHKTLENRFYRNIIFDLAKKIESMNQKL